MLTHKMDTDAALPLANGLGFVIGFFSVAALMIQQSLTFLLPLLLPPTVCTIFCILLYKTQQNSSGQTGAPQSPVRLDVI